jgi:hypothetical protein
MAAEAGKALAVLFRPVSASSQASPAHLRLVVGSRGGHLTLTVPKRRGPPLHTPIVLRTPGRPAARAAA